MMQGPTRWSVMMGNGGPLCAADGIAAAITIARADNHVRTFARNPLILYPPIKVARISIGWNISQIEAAQI